MNEKDIINSIGYCGRVCALCKDAKYCEGCKSKHATRSRHEDSKGCYQYQCCQKKGIQGCWDCDDSPCGEDMFSDDRNIRYRAFIRFAKYEGVEELGKCIFINQVSGIKYGDDKDYDHFQKESEVVGLLTKHYLVND